MNRLTITVFLISLLFIGCGDGDSSNPAQNSRFNGWGAGAGGGRVTSVETEPVKRGLIAEQVRSFGTIKAQDIVAINPQVSNRIVEIYVDLGDTVQQGQRLAKIYDVTFKDQLEQAKAQLAQAKVAIQRDSTQFARQKRLLESDAISQTEFDQAFATFRNSQSQYQSAVASVTQAQENFNNTTVRSPVKGVVISRTAVKGDIASAGQTLFEVANLVGYETRIYLPVQDWKAVKIGQSVRLRVTNEGDASANGVVSRKSPQLDPTTGLGEVVVTLTEVGESIYPGVLTENVIDIINKPNAVIVERGSLVEKVETVIEPESNTIQLERTYSVFVSKGDSVAELRQVELGIEQGDKIEIISGINVGDEIVVTGQQSLQDGGKIRVASQASFQSNSTNTRSVSSGNDASNTEAQRARPERNGDSRALFENMDEDERANLRKRMQNMSREERGQLMDSLRTANSSGN